MDSLQKDIKRIIGEKQPNYKLAVIRLVGLATTLILFGTLIDWSKVGNSGSGRKGDESRNIWVPAGGSIWSGVRLYFGEGQQKLYVGEVLGGNENYVDPYTGRKFRAIKILSKSGSVEWKDRNAVISGPWYIKRNDPALDRMEWYEFQF